MSEKVYYRTRGGAGYGPRIWLPFPEEFNVSKYLNSASIWGAHDKSLRLDDSHWISFECHNEVDGYHEKPSIGDVEKFLIEKGYRHYTMEEMQSIFRTHNPW